MSQVTLNRRITLTVHPEGTCMNYKGFGKNQLSLVLGHFLDHESKMDPLLVDLKIMC